MNRAVAVCSEAKSVKITKGGGLCRRLCFQQKNCLDRAFYRAQCIYSPRAECQQRPTHLPREDHAKPGVRTSRTPLLFLGRPCGAAVPGTAGWLHLTRRKVFELQDTVCSPNNRSCVSFSVFPTRSAASGTLVTTRNLIWLRKLRTSSSILAVDST